MNTTHRERARQAGFSLVEMSIVLVIIGLIVAAVAAGKNAMQNSQTVRAYKKVVEVCISQLQADNTRTGIEHAAITAGDAFFVVPGNITLDGGGGGVVKCAYAKSDTDSAGTLTISGANKDLRNMAWQNLDAAEEFVVDTIGTGTSFDIQMYIVGAATQPEKTAKAYE